jgi:dipeptide/tripeptide permease
VSFYLAGLAAGIAAVPDKATDAQMESIYSTAFTDYGWIGLGGGLLLLALVPWLKRLMGHVAEETS